MTKSATYSKYAKKESANVRKCLKDNKNRQAPKQEYVSNKKQQYKSKNNQQIESEKNDTSKNNGRPLPLPKNAKKDFVKFECMPELQCSFVPIVDAGMMSRLLYSNPVCFLSTVDAENVKRNVMTMSWLSPANNYGGFVFVIHKTRCSAAGLIHHKTFNLSIANASQIELLLDVSKCSGKTTCKFDGSIPNLTAVPFGCCTKDSEQKTSSSIKTKSMWAYMDENMKEANKPKRNQASNAFTALGYSSESEADDAENEEEEGQTDVQQSAETGEETAAECISTEHTPSSSQVVVASSSSGHGAVRKAKMVSDPQFVGGCIAHLKCRVLSVGDAADEGHYLVVASVTEACAHPQYWSDKARCLAPVLKDLPPLVTFLGSQQFAAMTAL